jgi:hypothetical protein
VAWQHRRMATGILMAESLRDDATLQVSWQLTRIERVAATNQSEEQRAAGLSTARTVLHFELTDAKAQALAQALADGLMRSGWCAQFNTAAETFTVFADRVFRYQRTDEPARAEAYAYGIAHGIPEDQLFA